MKNFSKIFRKKYIIPYSIGKHNAIINIVFSELASSVNIFQNYIL